jgi:ABC-2 type transport system ATP-binding protein
MIEVKKIHKRYNGTIAIQEATFECEEGEILGIIGPNGAGKTTLLKIIVGLLEPDNGEVKINNMSIQKDSIEIKKILGYVPEEPFLYKKLTGMEFLNFIGDIKNLSQDRKEKEIQNFLTLFNLQEKSNTLIETYSYGMKKKIALTSAFIGSPRVLILDEPTHGLDPTSTYIMKQLILERANKGSAILIATHILSLAEELCSKIIILNKGQIIKTIEINRTKKTIGVLEETFIKVTANRNM